MTATQPVLQPPLASERLAKLRGRNIGTRFDVVSDYKPAGDQPAAIAALSAAVAKGEHDQVLLGVTGSGKTFTMAHVIA
ncbi:MAG: DEAD/DEAH box helicase family protein, partial [Alphaproteobacteria bacterium]